MTCESCKSGFNWEGSPAGFESTLAGNKTYVTGTSKSAAILIIHDIFGWTFSNLRLLADHYAREANATVFLPKFFGGEVVPPDVMDDEAKRAAIDLPAFIERNSKELRFPEILACCETLKKDYGKVGAIGFCYGGWAVFQLSAKGSGIVDCISTAHPTLLTEEEIDAGLVPVQIIAPEHDHRLTPGLKEYCNKVIPGRNLPYEYVYFPGMEHGFATRGDPNNEKQRQGLERAKRSAVNWFNEWLH